MPLKTAQQYLDEMRNRRINLYVLGEKVEKAVDHPLIKASANAMALTYGMAQLPEYADIMLAKSTLTGNTINRFTSLYETKDDLANKIKMQRVLGQKTGTCFQRCGGTDCLNTLYTITHDIDKKYGTPYHERLRKYLIYVQENDLALNAAMTDPRGDRSKGTTEQADPDLYMKIVERRSDGVIVRGCKPHLAGALNCHELIVLPNNVLKPGEEDYAIVFAIPLDTPGLTFVYGRKPSDTRAMEEGGLDCGNMYYSGIEALAIFDNVFVPWDRIFMNGEVEFNLAIITQFSAYHRHAYSGCKTGVGDCLIGAAKAMAEYNGTDKVSHIKEKITEMCFLNETIFSCGLGCAAEAKPTSAGNYASDPLIANICKQYVTKYPYELARLAQDIAGGLIATLPSAQDFSNPEIGPLLQRYTVGRADVPGEHRRRMARLIENLTAGTGAGAYLTESMHGAGSPQSQRIMISRLVDLKFRKELAETLCGIKENADINWE